MGLSVDADIPASTDLSGKVVTDIQTGVVVGNGAITGTLKYVGDYSSAFGTDEDSGNYLALHCEAEDGAVIVVSVMNSETEPVTLDEDGLCVLRITDKDAQTIRVSATKGTDSVTKEYSLTGLTLEGEV